MQLLHGILTVAFNLLEVDDTTNAAPDEGPLVRAPLDLLLRWAWLRTSTALLPRRQRQVLALLQRGFSEKQVARELKLSRHTVHVYAKMVYGHFGVESRSELLALWVSVLSDMPTKPNIAEAGD